MQEIFTTRAEVHWFPTITDAAVLRILFGIINDAGGLGITPGGKPVPEPPWGPMMDILRSLVVHEVSRQIGDPLGRQLEKEAMTTIAQIASKEAKR